MKMMRSTLKRKEEERTGTEAGTYTHLEGRHLLPPATKRDRHRLQRTPPDDTVLPLQEPHDHPQQLLFAVRSISTNEVQTKEIYPTRTNPHTQPLLVTKPTAYTRTPQLLAVDVTGTNNTCAQQLLVIAR